MAASEVQVTLDAVIVAVTDETPRVLAVLDPPGAEPGSKPGAERTPFRLPSGLLDAERPNLTRHLFTDPRARTFFANWEEIADQQVFDLWLAPTAENSEWFTTELAPVAGPEFTHRLHRHVVPRRSELRIDHPSAGELRLLPETLELPEDAQQLLVLLPADEQTAQAIARLGDRPHGRLRAIS